MKLNLPAREGTVIGSMKGLENESNLTTEQFINETIMDISQTERMTDPATTDRDNHYNQILTHRSGLSGPSSKNGGAIRNLPTNSEF